MSAERLASSKAMADSNQGSLLTSDFRNVVSVKPTVRYEQSEVAAIAQVRQLLPPLVVLFAVPE